MRPVHFFLVVLFGLTVVDGALYLYQLDRREADGDRFQKMATAVAALGLTDLCVATEARYTRHPAVSDPMAPFMDHPGALEHFPSGSFWTPPGR